MSMALLDDWLIAMATRFAHAVQQATGKTSFFLARCGLLVSGAGLLMSGLNHFHPLFSFHGGAVDAWLSFGFIAAIIIPMFEMLKNADQSLGSVLPSLLLGLRSSPRFIRLIILGLGIFSLMTAFIFIRHEQFPLLYLVHHCSSLGLAAYHYFLMVDPLPPCRGTLFTRLEQETT
jgi:hypothetical protein